MEGVLVVAIVGIVAIVALGGWMRLARERRNGWLLESGARTRPRVKKSRGSK